LKLLATNRKIHREYIENLRGLVGGDFDFFSESFSRFETDFAGSSRVDPRIRYDGTVDRGCLYHCHREEDLWRTWDGGEEVQSWADGVEDEEDEDAEDD
jgi:hypothetical protein